MTDPDRRQAIQDAFWGGVRSVLLIDDEFPTYEKLATSQTPATSTGGELALKLWKGFRNDMNLACDIASEPPSDPRYLSYRDFIVLDYELSKGDRGKTARTVLAGLTSSTRQSLVLVYTHETDLQEIKLSISASLVGLPPLEPLDEEQSDEFPEWTQGRERPSRQAIYAYIQGSKEWLGLTSSSLDDALFAAHWLRSYIPDASAIRPATANLAFEVSDETGPQWVRCGSVFVALMNKDPEHTADMLRDTVIDALWAWNPSFMRILLGIARNNIVEQGLMGDDRVLRDAETEAGWMFYLDDPVANIAQRRERLRLLYGRLVDDLLDEEFLKLMDFSTRHGLQTLPDNAQSDSNKILEAAMRRCKIENKEDRKLCIIHKLNHYLALERLTPSRIRAGTVFSDEGETEFGVVVTPDCDLQPGRDKHEDAKSLGTYFRVVYRPAFKAEQSKPNKYSKYYKEAENFAHVFLNVQTSGPGVGYLTLSFTPPGEKQVPTRVLYVENTGLITDACFSASRVERDHEHGHLNMSIPRRYRVIGQLRDRYALRLLDEAGHYLSRVGVDFVRWPPR